MVSLRSARNSSSDAASCINSSATRLMGSTFFIVIGFHITTRHLIALELSGYLAHPLEFSAHPQRALRLTTNSLRYLCVLGVSAVEKCAPDLYRRDAENAEVAQRSSFKSFISFYQGSRAAPGWSSISAPLFLIS